MAVTFKIGDIVIAISSEQQGDMLHLDEAYNDFLSCGEPEDTIKAHYNYLPDIFLREEDKVFDSETTCSQIAEKILCYELGVVLDRHIVDFVRCVR